jgi:hypothetical protein
MPPRRLGHRSCDSEDQLRPGISGTRLALVTSATLQSPWGRTQIRWTNTRMKRLEAEVEWSQKGDSRSRVPMRKLSRRLDLTSAACYDLV